MNIELIITRIRDLDENEMKQVTALLDKLKYIKMIDVKKNIDASSPKYLVLLGLLNNILVNNNKSTIDIITDFKNIPRQEIIKPENKQMIEAMEDEIFKHYNKISCGWSRKNRVKHYILTLLKTMCSDINLEFQSTKKNISLKGHISTQYSYSIV